MNKDEMIQEIVNMIFSFIDSQKSQVLGSLEALAADIDSRAVVNVDDIAGRLEEIIEMARM